MGLQIVYLGILGSLLLTGCTDPLLYAEPTCSIDKLNHLPYQPELHVKRTEPLHLGGWAFDAISRRAPDSISIILVSATSRANSAETGKASADLSKVYEGKPNVPRPDVVATYKAESSQVAGFDMDVPIASMTPGLYEIHISQTFSNRILVCRIPRIIIIE